MDHDRALSSPEGGISDHLKLEIALLESSSEQAAMKPSQGPEKAIAVLTVDDDADVCTYVERCLKAVGFPLGRAYQAADGYDALETLAGEPVDLVISDVLMPRMDGLTLCERLFDDPRLRHIPVILMSGEMTLGEVRQKIRQDAVGLIAKPFSARTLRDAIDQLWKQLPPA